MVQILPEAGGPGCRETTGLAFLQGVGQFTPRAAALSRGMVVRMVPPVLHELTLPSAGAT